MDKIQKIGSYLLGGAIFIGVVLLPVMFIKGGVWAFEVLYPFLDKISLIGWVIVIALLLLSIFPRARGFAGAGLFITSYLWGSIFWLTSLAIVFGFWGWLGVVIGMFLAGIGVFGVALLALIFSGQVFASFLMLVSLGMIYGFRILGISMIEKFEAHQREQNIKRIYIEGVSK